MAQSAGAYRMLRRLDLGPSLDDRYGGPCLEFHNRGYNDSYPSCLVTITHPLALSLLQARLLDLKLPICVRLKAAAVHDMTAIGKSMSSCALR